MLAEDAAQPRTGRGVPGPRRTDELSDLVQCEPQGFRVANELEPVEVHIVVESIATGAPRRRREKPVKIVVAQSLDGEPGPAGGLTDPHGICHGDLLR
jgi:hypothetical protein